MSNIHKSSRAIARIAHVCLDFSGVRSTEKNLNALEPRESTPSFIKKGLNNMTKKPHYNYAQLRRDIQDEYLASMLVGMSEDTPDLMDVQMAANDSLPELAEKLGFKLSDYIIPDEDFERESERLKNSQYH